ncbi:cupin domain-containing protein [Diaminobutyricibacter tongyongensis]|uniref:Cupin domain-containing protein n=1 Tax=Leifsonia tongyongensis TaxID=1268043 RepID=A0A6L9XUD2_9MICO|nr:cupin domain-containing protein [Diaminobutyricibacter tongyongensis]
MNIEPQQPTSAGPAERFIGQVWVDLIAPSAAQLTAGIVRFAPGAHTAWHVHAHGQTLHITEGTALIQARGGDPLVAHAGDTVYTPPGEWHWHGATDTGFMTHLALSASPADADGATVTWGEHISDADYAAANRAARAGAATSER